MMLVHDCQDGIWINASKGLITQYGEIGQLVDRNSTFGFRGSNSTSGCAVQANPTRPILLYLTFWIMTKIESGVVRGQLTRKAKAEKVSLRAEGEMWKS